MKFSSSVDSLTKENNFLRSIVKLFASTAGLLALVVLFLHDRAPVVVERSSRGLEIVRMTELHRSEEDIKQALKLMLKARFDSGAINSEYYLSRRQTELREAEQREMKGRNLYQSIVFRNSTVSKDEAVVEFDRILSVGDVRSALKTTIKVAFEETEPSEENPYGLKLALASPIETKEGKK